MLRCQIGSEREGGREGEGGRGGRKERERWKQTEREEVSDLKMRKLIKRTKKAAAGHTWHVLSSPSPPPIPI
jgi:hypothetical protein